MLPVQGLPADFYWVELDLALDLKIINRTASKSQLLRSILGALGGQLAGHLVIDAQCIAERCLAQEGGVISLLGTLCLQHPFVERSRLIERFRASFDKLLTCMIDFTQFIGPSNYSLQVSRIFNKERVEWNQRARDFVHPAHLVQLIDRID